MAAFLTPEEQADFRTRHGFAPDDPGPVTLKSPILPKGVGRKLDQQRWVAKEKPGRPVSNGLPQLAQADARQSDRRPYLSELHNEILREAARNHMAPGTREWSNWDGVAHRKDPGYLKRFKDQWVRGYRATINTAAKRFDLPPELVAAVAHIEVGGAPPMADGFAYSIREEAGRTLPIPDFIPGWIKRGVNAPKDQTSFGPLSVQVRRAASSLGYGTDQDLTESQRRALISSLEDPRSGIFVAAKHLSDLRDKAFGRRAAEGLGEPEIQLLGGMYNGGPQVIVGSAPYRNYGGSVLKRLSDMRNLLAASPRR